MDTHILLFAHLGIITVITFIVYVYNKSFIHMFSYNVFASLFVFYFPCMFHELSPVLFHHICNLLPMLPFQHFLLTGLHQNFFSDLVLNLCPYQFDWVKLTMKPVINYTRFRPYTVQWLISRHLTVVHNLFLLRPFKSPLCCSTPACVVQPSLAQPNTVKTNPSWYLILITVSDWPLLHYIGLYPNCFHGIAIAVTQCGQAICTIPIPNFCLYHTMGASRN